jgi:hypothetical protein|eukprot:COSAG03_NODE_1923_length_3352_cov_2.871196_3_plen_66_part_00
MCGRVVGAGVAPKDFVQILGGTVEMLSTNIDRTGRAFVSTFEAKSYPFCELGVLWPLHTTTRERL